MARLVRVGLDVTFPIPFGLKVSDLSLQNKRIAKNPHHIKTSFNSTKKRLTALGAVGYKMGRLRTR